MAKETYYFSHDANARNDEKILMLRADCGMEGYGVFWALIETMFETSETALYHDKVKGLSLSYNIDISQLEKIINVCIENELFESDGTIFWSNSLRSRKEKYCTIKEKRSEGGKKAMANRWAKNSITNECDSLVISELQSSNNLDITHDNKGNEIKKKLNKKENENIYSDEIIDYLNLKSGKSFKCGTSKTSTCLNARWNEGFKDLEQYKKVIDIKCDKWLNDPKMADFIRPETLFGGKFESYLNESGNNGSQNEYGPTKPVGFNTWPIEDKMKWLSENGGI